MQPNPPNKHDTLQSILRFLAPQQIDFKVEQSLAACRTRLVELGRHESPTGKGYQVAIRHVDEQVSHFVVQYYTGSRLPIIEIEGDLEALDSNTTHVTGVSRLNPRVVAILLTAIVGVAVLQALIFLSVNVQGAGILLALIIASDFVIAVVIFVVFQRRSLRDFESALRW